MSYAAERYGYTRPHHRAAVKGPLHSQPVVQPIVRRNGKGRDPQNRRRETSRRIIDVARQDVVKSMRRRGFLYAENFEDAVGQLFKALRHSKEVIRKALRQLIGADVVRHDSEGVGYYLAA